MLKFSYIFTSQYLLFQITLVVSPQLYPPFAFKNLSGEDEVAGGKGGLGERGMMSVKRKGGGGGANAFGMGESLTKGLKGCF